MEIQRHVGQITKPAHLSYVAEPGQEPTRDDENSYVMILDRTGVEEHRRIFEVFELGMEEAFQHAVFCTRRYMKTTGKKKYDLLLRQCVTRKSIEATITKSTIEDRANRQDSI